MSNPSITADKTPWYQWDTGLTVTVSGGAMTECHFANRKQGTAYVQAVINGVARVPDELLQVAAPIKAYGYVSDGAGGQTYIEGTFEVIARNIPSDYTYTKTAQKTIRDAEVARDEAVQAAKDAKASELAADDSAVEASNSAQSAGESASAATTSASNAAKSAGDAANSASDAKAAADNAVEDASDLLKTYTDNAKTSADNAATSASNAADAASAASGSASAASTSASEAATSAQEANDAAGNAASEVLAATKANADAAAKSATDAATAKAGADTAASNAATSASNAASSATAAAKSAGDAAASVDAINVIAPKTVDVAASSDVDGSVAVGAGSVAKKENEFSIGNDTTQREITHVSTPKSETSAATKKYTDDNDAKTLSESKKYTDANTSNALVSTVSGKLLHVEDAWPGKPLGLTIDGAYKQDGTPSPENPVPITVVENPTLKVTGRNLIDVHEGMQESDCDKYFDKDIKRIIKPGTYVAGLTSNNYMQTIKISDAVFSEGGLTFSSTAGGYGVGVGVSLVPGKTYVRTFKSINAVCAIVFYSSDGTHLSYAGTEVFTVPVDAVYSVMLIVPTSVNQPVSATDIFIKLKGTAGTYAPYTSVSLPITLPAEHPYLAALPDGTHDEIVIDKDGNASLVARVGKTETAATDGVNATVGTDAISSTGAIADGAVVYYKLATPVTYTLGKLDIPSLPDSISNVWTDAELATNMHMTYKRDINIAFDNLVQSVVAAAAGE